jgi:hypothetical protein
MPDQYEALQEAHLTTLRFFRYQLQDYAIKRYDTNNTCYFF